MEKAIKELANENLMHEADMKLLLTETVKEAQRLNLIDSILTAQAPVKIELITICAEGALKRITKAFGSMNSYHSVKDKIAKMIFTMM